MKSFKTTGACTPDKNYMVDLTDRIIHIKHMVDAGQYFTINRAQQYGKTTTLAALANYLKDDYIVLSLDFQGLDEGAYRDGGTFKQSLAQMILDEYEFNGVKIPSDYFSDFKSICQTHTCALRMADIFRIFKRW